MRGATLLASASAASKIFQSTLLMRGATRQARPRRTASSHFNPRSSCEERLVLVAVKIHQVRFQSTLLMRGATAIEAADIAGTIFQSTLLMRGATQDRSDYTWQSQFQSTLLMRGATHRQSSRIDSQRNFNPRSSCEERPIKMTQTMLQNYFNPRSSCEERPPSPRATTTSSVFQSTLLMRGATAPRRRPARYGVFQSTLLMRGATPLYWSNVTKGNFNPRSSCEERQRASILYEACKEISIHAPHARSDVENRVGLRFRDISIHAPHARSDVPMTSWMIMASIFQSTLLMRGATEKERSSRIPSEFQSTLLMRGATRFSSLWP